MSIRFRAATMAALLFLLGCGGGGGKVSGKVTLNGVPLTVGVVTFHPTGTGPIGIGQLDADGRYEISVGTAKSLPPGEYIVTVQATEPLEKNPVDKKGKPRPPVAPKLISPAKYATKEGSNLRKTITSGSNEVNLELSN